MDRPPAGWIAFDGLIVPGPKVEDYAARRQSVKGGCRAEGCNRRIELEPSGLCKAGMGQLAMSKVSRQWRCGRFDGCQLQFHEEKPLFTLRLEHFIGLPHVRIRVRCDGNGCKFFQLHRAEEMIAGLEKRGQGDERTEIDKLGPMMKTGCPLCKKTNWRADVLWRTTDTIGWRSIGEQVFDQMVRQGAKG